MRVAANPLPRPAGAAAPSPVARRSSAQRGRTQRSACSWRGVVKGFWEREGKRTADAELAFSGQIATHATREIAADRETESDTLARAREARVDLHERLEDARQLVGLNADARVAHGDRDHRIARFA